MEELEFTEDYENQVILCSTPKRKAKLKLFIPYGNSTFWRITYEDGRPVTGLEGAFTSAPVAKQAVVAWHLSATKTKDAKQYELFGDKEPPVLKRKQRVRAART